MSYLNNINGLQNMLGILLQTPDPKQMLRHSKPFDRDEGQIKVVEQGQIQKYKWQGALPRKLRDERLQLNYDRLNNKVKNSLQTHNNSQQLQLQHSIKNKRDFNTLRHSGQLQNQSFSVDYRLKGFINSSSNKNEENSLFLNNNLNQSAMIQSNNFFDNVPTPHSTSNRCVNLQNQQNLQNNSINSHSMMSPSQLYSHNLLSPKNNTFYNYHHHHHLNNNMSGKDTKSEEQKSLSIKYIGVHNDMIGVLSRKIPMEQQIEKISKCKQIQSERRVRSGVGQRIKQLSVDRKNQLEEFSQSQMSDNKLQITDIKSPIQKNKITINLKSNEKTKRDNISEEKKVHNDLQEEESGLETHLMPMSDENKNQLLSISQKLSEIQENVEMENKQSQLELNKMSHPEQAEKRRQHQNALRQVLEEQDSISKPITPIKNGDILNNQQNENRKVDNTQTTLSSTQNQRFYGNPIPKDIEIFDNKINNQLNTNNSRPNTTVQSRQYYSYIGQQVPSTSNSQRTHSLNHQRKIIQNDSSFNHNNNNNNNNNIDKRYQENNYILIDKGNGNGNTPISNKQNEQQHIPNYEIPEPSKYNKFIVTKYSLERKLTALKKTREQNPNYSKKQFYVVWNNQQINCLNQS